MPFIARIAETAPASPLAAAVEAMLARRAPQAASGPAGASRVAAAPVRRRKLWEIGAAFHCAVIGTCLTMPELRGFARQAGIDDWRSASDYALHHAAVHHAQERNALSALMHKALERRYAVAVKQWVGAGCDADVLRLWAEALRAGDVAGAVWAAMTHPASSEAARNRIGEELHMLSHQTGAASRADLQRMRRLQRDAEALAVKLQRLRDRSAKQMAQKDAAIADLERRLCALSGVSQRLEDGGRRRAARERDDALRQLEHALAAERRRARRAEERAEQLACDRDATGAEGAAPLAGRSPPCGTVDAHPARPACCERLPGDALCREDLAGRCVLFVGGRTGMVERYRRLVERCCGRFVHHDGGVESSLRRLQGLLSGADCVVCVAGHVSHGAYYAVKRYCKHDGKPCVLLKSPSLACFASGLPTLAGSASREPLAPRGAAVLLAARDERP